MVLHVAKGSFSDDVAHISFPTEVDKVRNEVIAVEEFGSWAPAYVIGGDGAAKVPASYIERDALFSEAGVQKLNQLAGLVDTMDLEAQKVFAGALMVEHAKCLDAQQFCQQHLHLLQRANHDNHYPRYRLH